MKNSINITLVLVLGCSMLRAQSDVTTIHTALPARLVSKAAAVHRAAPTYTKVEKIHTLNEERIAQEGISYGVYMIENIRGGNNRAAYACQDRVFAGTTVSKTMFAVCDGHGTEGAVVADEIAKKFPLEVLGQKNIKAGIGLACRRFQERYAKTPYAQQAGTTLVCGIFHNKTLTVGNVGDSRLIVIRPSRQSIPFSTVDHKGKPGRRLALSRSLGDIEMHKEYNLSAEPDVTTVSLEDNDIIVIASDGYWDTVTNDETYDLVTAGAGTEVALDCKAVAKKLAETARARASKDDISVVCVQYKVQ